MNLLEEAKENLKIKKNRYRIVKINHSNSETLFYLQFSTHWPWVWDNSYCYSEPSLLEKYALAVLDGAKNPYDKIAEVTEYLTKILKQPRSYVGQSLKDFSTGKTDKNSIEYEVIDDKFVKIENEFYIIVDEYKFSFFNFKFSDLNKAKDILNCMETLEIFMLQTDGINTSEFYNISAYLRYGGSKPVVDYEIVKTFMADENYQELPNDNIDLPTWDKIFSSSSLKIT